MSIPDTRAACRTSWPRSFGQCPAGGVMAAAPAADGGNRTAITACVILATLMQALDTTIANIALPYIQGSVVGEPGPDQLGADLLHRGGSDHDAADRLPRRRGSESSACSSLRSPASPSPPCCAAWRNRCRRSCCSGSCRACSARRSSRSRNPCCSSIYPKERHGFAMALFGVAVMVGPILGPVLGRLADRELHVALGLLHQPADRRARLPRHHHLPAGQRTQCGREARLVRLRNA